MLALVTEVLVDLLPAFWTRWLRLVLLHTDMEFAMITAFSRKIFVTAGR